MLCSQMHQCSIRRTVCVRVCMYFSPVLGRAALIGSQTRGISVLHNRVRRHREDGPRDLLGASERRASFWNTAAFNRHHCSGSSRGAPPHPLYRDFIIMIVWTGLLHAYTLWTVTCHKHGKLCVCIRHVCKRAWCVWARACVCAHCLCSGML